MVTVDRPHVAFVSKVEVKFHHILGLVCRAIDGNKPVAFEEKRMCVQASFAAIRELAIAESNVRGGDECMFPQEESGDGSDVSHLEVPFRQSSCGAKVPDGSKARIYMSLQTFASALP